MPGLGPRIGVAFYRAGIETGPVHYIVPEPDKLDGVSFQLTGLTTNLVCRIFGRNNHTSVLNITVSWDGVPMEKVIFFGEAGVGKPFAGIWALFGHAPSKAKIDIACGGKTYAGCAAIRIGSVGGAPVLVGTDYETDLSFEYPFIEGDIMAICRRLS